MLVDEIRALTEKLIFFINRADEKTLKEYQRRWGNKK